MMIPDVSLSWHAFFCDLARYEKLKTRGAADPNPFIDPQGYQAHVDEYEKIFEAALTRRQPSPLKAKTKAKTRRSDAFTSELLPRPPFDVLTGSPIS